MSKVGRSELVMQRHPEGKCFEISVADKGQMAADKTWPLQGPTFYVKDTTADAPLYTPVSRMLPCKLWLQILF